jgi:NAD(P)-dependent dehydrogenase (short-subunit alcohol dehydrogenase family)
MRQVAVVTGAGTGIGKATAHALLRADYRVFLLGRRHSILVAAAAESGLPESLATPIVCDVSVPDDVSNVFEKIGRDAGRIDLLFNNAGVSAAEKTIDEVAIEDWQRLVNVNLTGSFLCARMAFRMMREQQPQGGRIINNGSLSAHVPRPGYSAYTATKHAISGLTKSISLEGRPFNIACGQIDVGNALTEMTSATFLGGEHADYGGEPFIQAEQVAEAVLHMARQPPGSNIQSLMIMATNMPFVGRG